MVDVAIIGAGPAGLFAAYELITNNKNLKVVLVDRGKKALKRSCPMAKDGKCVNCRMCNILNGYGGAGTFSDGKLNFIPKLGKSDLFKYMSESEAYKLIDDTEEIFTKFGMDSDVYPSNMDEALKLKKQVTINGGRLLLIKQKHLGSDKLPKYIEDFSNYLEEKGVELKENFDVLDIVKEKDSYKLVSKKEEIIAKKVIVAPGRTGAKWIQEIADKYKIPYLSQSIEIGVRVVTKENYYGYICVNGHSLKEIKSNNSNFAFISKVTLTEPVTNTREYGESIARIANVLGDGKPIIQRLKDLRKGRRSTWSKIDKGYTEPTLKDCVAGDLSLVLPHRIVTNILEGLEKLDKIIPGVNNDDTLLYGPEIKFFSNEIETNNKFKLENEDIYFIGDGSGKAGNIVTAAATGLVAARDILKK